VTKTDEMVLGMKTFCLVSFFCRETEGPGLGAGACFFTVGVGFVLGAGVCFFAVGAGCVLGAGAFFGSAVLTGVLFAVGGGVCAFGLWVLMGWFLGGRTVAILPVTVIV